MSDGGKFLTPQYNQAGASFLPTKKHVEIEERAKKEEAEQERFEIAQRKLYDEKISDGLPKLYSLLVEEGTYTHGFDRFSQQFSNEESRKKLYDYLQSKKTYTKSYDDFNQQFFEKDAEYYKDYKADASYTNATIEGDYSKSASGFFNAITSGFKTGMARRNSASAIAEVMEWNPDGISSEDINEFIEASKEMDEAGPSRATVAWQASYDKYLKEGSTGVAAWMMATKDNGGSSFVETTISSLIGMLNMDTAKASVGGGVVGGTAFGVAGNAAVVTAVLPEEILTVPIGFAAGAWGTASGYNDALLTFQGSVKEELAARGQGMTQASIRELFQDEDFYYKARNTAIKRGIAIGVIESLFTIAGGAMASKVVTNASKGVVKTSRFIPKSSTVKKGLIVGGSEVAGGMTGEATGLFIQGKPFDAAEIINEGIGSVVGAPVTGAISLVSNNRSGSYKINGQTITAEKMQDFIDNADAETILKTNFTIKDDTELSNYVSKIQQEEQIKASINTKVTNKADRDALYELQTRAGKFAGDDSSFAKNQLADINEQIKIINSKYSRRGRKSKAQLQNEADRQRVIDAIKERKVQESIEFSKEASKLGLKTEIGKTTKEFTDKLKKDKVKLNKSQKSKINRIGGLIYKGKIYINKEVASKTFQVNVGAHELLHGIINSKVQNQRQLFNDLQRTLDPDINALIIKRMKDRGYTRSKQHQEYLTVFSDLLNSNDKSVEAQYIQNKFNDNGFVDQMKLYLKKIFRKFGYFNLDFNKAEDVVQFMKEYSNSVKKGELSKSLINEIGELTAESATFTEAQLSLSEVSSELVNDIYRDQGITNLSAFEMLNVLRPTAEGIARRYDQRPNYSEFSDILADEIQTGKRGMLDVIRSYPEYVKQQQAKGLDPAPISGYINKSFSTKSGFKRYIEIADRILGKDEASQFTTSLDDTTVQVADTATSTESTQTRAKIDPRNMLVKKGALKAYNDAVDINNIDQQNISFKKLKGKATNITAEEFGVPVSKIKDASKNFSKQDLVNSSKAISERITTIKKIMPKGAVLEAASEALIGTSTGVPKTLLDTFYTKQDRITKGAGIYPHTLNKLNDISMLNDLGINKDGTIKEGITPRSPEANKQRAIISLVDKLITNTIVKEKMREDGVSQNVIQDIDAGTADVQLSIEDQALADEFILGDTYIDITKESRKSIDDGVNAAEAYVNGIIKYIMPVFNKNSPGLANKGEFVNGLNLRNYTEVKLYLRAKLGNISFVKGNYPKRDFAAYIGKTVKDIVKNKSKIAKYNEQAGINFDEFWNNINEILTKNPEALGVVLAWLGNSISSKTHPNRGGAQFTYLDESNNGKVYLEHALQNARAYRTLIRSIMDPSKDFKSTLEALKKNYKLIGIKAEDNVKLDKSALKNDMDLTGEWNVFDNSWWERYFNDTIFALGGIDTNTLINWENGKSFLEENNINSQGIRVSTELQLSIDDVNKKDIILDALHQGRIKNKPKKGISVFDFDDTLARSSSEVFASLPDGSLRRLNATEFAIESADLEAAGATFDFSQFNQVVNGKKGPLFELALRRQDKFTSENIFILTARPQEASYAIHAFLKGIGLEIPIENITGLADGTPKAKADWILGKAAEGYNDFYFADDAYKNVKAVQDVLSQIDVKSDVQQAKIQLSLNEDFNNILEETKGVESQKVFSDAAAKSRGRGANKFTFFLPPSAEDFVGLIYSFLDKGKKGEAQLKFFEDNLIKPFTRGIQEINSAKQAYSNNYRKLQKYYPNVKKMLSRKTAYNDFTYDAAIRVYLWDKLGYKIPGISKTDQKRLSEIVSNDTSLKSYAEILNNITNKKRFPEPSENWVIGTIVSDLNDITQRVGRKRFLQDWIENKNEVFSKDNLNKIEAIYGTSFRDAIEDILYRMENGTNRQSGTNKLTNSFSNWVNNSVGAIMFFNFRSATLQTISLFNFINWSDNNPVKFAMAIGNVKQYASDFSMIFNSDMLQQRRRGLQTDVNEAEIAQAMSTSNNKPAAILRYLLQKGFIPTQMADSFAIASGGATFYRNRVNTYIKQGLNKKEAESKAFEDFADASEKAQQSARPDMISSQQASPLGRLILAFQNTPMQYMRLTKKAYLDLKNGRGDWKTNVSKIAYYAAIQNLIFSTLSNAMFGMMFDDEETVDWDRKKGRVVNNMMDTVLRGSGVYGAIASTLKNMVMRFNYEANKKGNPDYAYVVIEAVNLSPPVGSKARKLYNALQSYKFDADEMKDAGFSLDNPGLLAIGNVLSATANIPLDRAVMILNNIKEASDSENEAWQRIAMSLGWNTWDVGIDPYESQKSKKKKSKKRVQRVKKN